MSEAPQGHVNPTEFDNYDDAESFAVEAFEMDEVESLRDYPEGDDEDGS